MAFGLSQISEAIRGIQSFTRPTAAPTASTRGSDISRARIGSGPMGTLPGESARYFQSVPFKFAATTALPTTRARPQLTSAIAARGRPGAVRTSHADGSVPMGPAVREPGRMQLAQMQLLGPGLSAFLRAQIPGLTIAGLAHLFKWVGLEGVQRLLGTGLKETAALWLKILTRGRRRHRRGISYRQLSNAIRVNRKITSMYHMLMAHAPHRRMSYRYRTPARRSYRRRR